MERAGIRMITALLAAMLLFPGTSVSAEKKKTAAELAREKAQADAQIAADKAFDVWQDSAQWRAVLPEELAMTSEPRAPGASAILLYSEVTRNNVHQGEKIYWQTKILADEGRNNANITITYNQRSEKIRRIDARVIQPDGTIAEFSGEIYDRPLAAKGQMSINARSFTLPDVRVGSIIEVRYWRGAVFNPSNGFMVTIGNGRTMLVALRGIVSPLSPPRWVLNQHLFVRHAVYSLELAPRQFARWSLPNVLPPGASEPSVDKGVVRMEARNMPAFMPEDSMPPAVDVVPSVDFSYDRPQDGDEGSAAKYWTTFGVNQSKGIGNYLGPPKYVSRRLARIISKKDSPEQKYRKIYEHVRGMGNADLPGLMDAETRARCSKGNNHVWEMAEDRCGNNAELHLYFIALCRAADLPAVPVRASSRAERFFTPDTRDSSRLSTWLVAVKIDGREILLDPGVRFLPFGSLVWWDTAVPAFKLDPTGGEWFTTPEPRPADAVTRRTAKLNLSEDGTLEGTVLVKHTGHEATVRVIALLAADEQGRADLLREDLRYAMAVPAEITVVRQPDWNAGNEVLEIEYRIKVQQWAVSTGTRLLVGIGLFGNEQQGKFIAAKREHPIYFKFPFVAEDEIEITLPAGFRFQSAPTRSATADAALKYLTTVESKDGTVIIRRSLTHDLLLARQSLYPRIKSFYEMVRSGDQEQVEFTR